MTTDYSKYSEEAALKYFYGLQTQSQAHSHACVPTDPSRLRSSYTRQHFQIPSFYSDYSPSPHTGTIATPTGSGSGYSCPPFYFGNHDTTSPASVQPSHLNPLTQPFIPIVPSFCSRLFSPSPSPSPPPITPPAKHYLSDGNPLFLTPIDSAPTAPDVISTLSGLTPDPAPAPAGSKVRVRMVPEWDTYGLGDKLRRVSVPNMMGWPSSFDAGAVRTEVGWLGREIAKSCGSEGDFSGMGRDPEGTMDGTKEETGSKAETVGSMISSSGRSEIAPLTILKWRTSGVAGDVSNTAENTSSPSNLPDGTETIVDQTKGPADLDLGPAQKPQLRVARILTRPIPGDGQAEVDASSPIPNSHARTVVSPSEEITGSQRGVSIEEAQTQMLSVLKRSSPGGLEFDARVTSESLWEDTMGATEEQSMIRPLADLALTVAQEGLDIIPSALLSSEHLQFAADTGERPPNPIHTAECSANREFEGTFYNMSDDPFQLYQPPENPYWADSDPAFLAICKKVVGPPDGMGMNKGQIQILFEAVRDIYLVQRGHRVGLRKSAKALLGENSIRFRVGGSSSDAMMSLVDRVTEQLVGKVVQKNVDVDEVVKDEKARCTCGARKYE